MDIFFLIIAVIVGSMLSLLGGIVLLNIKKYRGLALVLTMPFGAGALLAAAFFDLLPESFERADPSDMMLYCLGGFMIFFILERCATWFHHHHDHDDAVRNVEQRWLIVMGDVMHNAIDGLAIGAAFLVSVPTGIITTIAVSMHEIPKELGTFALLLARGWKDSKVLIANLVTALATIITAVLVFTLGKDLAEFIPPLLALTSGFFIYIAASDIIPDIHEQPQKIGTIQAAMLVGGTAVVGYIILQLGV